MDGQATAVLDPPPVVADSVAQWAAFIAAIEVHYAQLAHRAGQPHVRHTPDELLAVVELAASLDLQVPVEGAEHTQVAS